MELRRMIAALAVLAPLSPFATLAGSQTINFGANLPAGPVPAGYSGFNWGTGANAAPYASLTREVISPSQ